jgi:hypothetical protein
MENLVALGKPMVRHLSDEEILALRVMYDQPVNRLVYEYKRFVWKGKAYDTLKYTRSCTRKNCNVTIHSRGNIIHCCILSLATIKCNCTCIIQHHEQCECDKECFILFTIPCNRQ